MWLIVGLGNPGSRYAKTRHNVGFVALEDLAGKKGLTFKDREEYRISRGSMGSEEIALIEPLTFMNRSGVAVRKVSGKFAIPPERIIVIHDDIDLETGRLKIRKKGSSGGHKGIESIIENLGANNFIRVKIGVGRDAFVPVEEYVLSRFRKEEVPLIGEAVSRVVDAVPVIIAEGVEKAMNRFQK